MRNSIWNVLSSMLLLGIIGVIAVFALVFLNPYTQLNPFPPPTLPAAMILSTFTPTYQQFPPTWTPGSGQPIVVITYRPSSTPLSTPGVNSLNPPTRVAVRTRTPTPTITPTQTRTGSPSASPSASVTASPNFTTTALSALVTNAAATSQAKTQTAQAGSNGATQTSQAQTATAQAMTATAQGMPQNPTTATETHGAASNTWQNQVSDPAFTWDAVAGASEYYVYWGTSASGTSTSTTPTASYDPGAVSSGTYYLRLRTKFPWGERPDWSTVFILRVDIIAPNPPSNCVETHGASSATWQNSIADAAFTWNDVSDAESGFARYDIYFGANPNGSSAVATSGTPAYDPDPVSSGTFYLRVRSVDNASNTSAWVTLFILRYDGTPPSAPADLTQTNADPANPSFTWTASSDSHSGISAYEIFWQKDASTCDNPNQPDVTDTSFSPGTLTEAGTYRLCVRAADNAGNTSSWTETTHSYNP